jgi:hypothetical protein
MYLVRQQKKYKLKMGEIKISKNRSYISLSTALRNYLIHLQGKLLPFWRPLA